jgi:hypothetical protein
MEESRIEAVRERNARTKASNITSPVGCGGNIRRSSILLALNAAKEKKKIPIMMLKGKQWRYRM